MLKLGKWSSGQAASDRIQELEKKLSVCEAAAEKATEDRALLKELEAKIAAVHRSQAVIEFKLDGTIITANENFLGAVGYGLSEVSGRHHSIFVDREYASGQEYRHFWERLNRGEFISAKFRRLAKGGREIWIQASYNPLFDENGQPYKVVKFATDITAEEHERRRTDDERTSRARELADVVSTVGQGLKELADGHLSHRINGSFPADYEQLRVNFNAAIDKLNAKIQEALTGINANADAIRAGTAEMSRAADDLSQRTEQQAASLEQTAAALGGITQTVHKTAESAKQASSTVTTARGEAEHSGEIVGRAVSAMQEIEGSSRKVSQIIGVIDEIAFQTNLLALNAGVEAARAGEAGRGFAVVASEVRALAQRAAEAAKEIKALISASSQHVETGSKLVGETGHALSRIVQRVNEINKLVSEIASGAQEQAVGLNQVNTAIGEMDRATQQNAAMVEESTAAIHGLAKEADTMVALMGKFDLGATAAGTHRAMAPAPGGPRLASTTAQVSALRSKARTTPRKSSALAAEDEWREF